MRKSVLLLAALFVMAQAFGNAAMPGLWQTGHGGRFIPLFKEDSLHFGKIQMQKELVLIDLFPGFTAVKGEYWMYNTTDQTITLRVGYPINGRYDAALVDNVMFRDLYQLQVKLNGQEVNILKATDYDSLQLDDRIEAENWYFFTCVFPPKQLTKISVYFLTNNSEAKLGRGYGRDNGNAFAYILETGRARAGKIEKGEVLIRLNKGLSLADFRGVYPVNTLVGDDHHLKFAFTNLEPDSSDNILLWYTPDMPKGFNFQSVSNAAIEYYRRLDVFPVAEFDNTNFKTITKDDFEPHDSGLTWLWVVLIGIVVIALLVLAGVIYLVVRLVRRKRRA